MSISRSVSDGYKKESPMRNVLHKTKEMLKGRGRIILITEHKEDHECISDVRKEFVYAAREADREEALPAPQVHIEKFYDGTNRDEFFSLRVKGAMYMYRSRRLMKIGYSHRLKIRLHWKSQSASPKKSVTLA